jgi:hypothetical protein
MSALPTPLRLVHDAGTALVPGYVAPRSRIDELKRRRTIRNLFRDINSGKWRRVLLDLGNSQHRFRELARHSGQIEALLTKVNLVRLAFRFHGTVAAGNPVNTVVGDGNDEQAAAVDAIRRRVNFDAMLQEAIRKVNIEAEAVLRVSVVGGGGGGGETGTVINLDDNDRTIPVGPNGPDGQPTVWERRWKIERPSGGGLGGRKKVYLRVERHRRINGVGVIEQEAYTSRDQSGGEEISDVLCHLADLKRVPLTDAVDDPPAELTETGASGPAIVRLVADMEDGEPAWMLTKDDLDIIDESAAAFSRLSRAHDLHSQPILRIPEHMVDPATGTVTLTEDAIVDPDKMAEYIGQNFDLGKMLDLMDRVLGLTLVMLQMSQALLGFKMGGGSAPDSYEKLRLESTSTLARGKQTAIYCNGPLGQLFTRATEIDARQPMRGYATSPVTCEMRPELPKDRVELVKEIGDMLDRSTPLISHRRAIAAIHGERNADAILDEIRADQEAAAKVNASSLFMGGDA